MASITIKNLPAALHMRLKERAKRNRRSLNAELIVCLESVLSSAPIDVERELQELAVLREQVGGYLTSERIDALIEEGRRH